MRTFVTSDLHLGHENILRHCRRPFKTIEEMDSVIIERWNEIITERDQVYVLGDFSLGSPAVCKSYLRQLRGRKFLVRGNHDRVQGSTAPSEWDYVSAYCEVKHPSPVEESRDLKVVMFHFPIERWNGQHHGAVHLHGHSHCPVVSRRERHGRLDVGVDGNDFRPWLLQDAVWEAMRGA